MKASERYKQHYLQPLKNGTGLQPHQFGEYRGIPLSADTLRRMAEYRAIPSLYA